MAENKKSGFPKNFLWGASTSAYQVEGGNHNQWSVWELAHAAELAKKAENHYGKLPIWPAIKEKAQDPNNYVSGQGVDHYHRYEEDFDLLKKLNLNAFRFGIEWSRIEPHEGRYDQAVIDHYIKYINELKDRGIQPVINIWHWTMPLWFEAKGGFSKRKNIKYFERFVEHIANDLIIPCHWVITINEPNSYVGMGYFDRQWPPQSPDFLEALSVIVNLATAHKRVYRLLKNIDPELIIGVATQCNNNRPKRPGNYLDRLIAGWANYVWNWWFLNRIRRCQDFVGFNYYFTDYFKGVIRKNPQSHYKHHAHIGHRGVRRENHHNPPGPLSDMGWYMEPGGIYNVIMQAAKRYKKPIVITETGVADLNDKYRKWWLQETITAMEMAQKHGVDIRGYFYWSLLDNFEWSQGWWPKFGLVEVNREDGMKRRPRESAKWFAEKIKQLSK